MAEVTSGMLDQILWQLEDIYVWQDQRHAFSTLLSYINQLSNVLMTCQIEVLKFLSMKMVHSI